MLRITKAISCPGAVGLLAIIATANELMTKEGGDVIEPKVCTLIHSADNKLTTYIAADNEGTKIRTDFTMPHRNGYLMEQHRIVTPNKNLHGVI